MAEFHRRVATEQRALNVPPSRRATIDESIEEYALGARSADLREDVKLAMSRILLHRYANRVPQQSLAIFELADPEPSVPLKPNSGVAEGARAHLRALFGRAYHYGIDDLSDASDENAELFLQLAGALEFPHGDACHQAIKTGAVGPKPAR